MKSSAGIAPLVLLVNLLVGGLASAQPSAEDAFKAARAEWDKLDTQIVEVVKKYRAAKSDDERKELRNQFEELQDQGQKLLPKLRSTAIAAYQAAPNKDEEVDTTLLGLIASDLQKDDYQNASKVSQMLLDNKSTAKGLVRLAGVAAYCTHDFDAAEKLLKQAEEEGELDRVASQYLSDIPTKKEQWKREAEIRAAEAKTDDLPRVKMETSQGDIVIELFENEAPQAVANFVNLVERKFYDGLVFHRVLAGFMAQGGCPRGTGSGGPGYNIYCECYKDNIRHHFTGTLSMAHAGRDTGGSQFFLTFRPTPHLDGKHTVFGRVIEGLDVLPKLKRINPGQGGTPDKIIKATVIRKRDHEYVPTKVQ